MQQQAPAAPPRPARHPHTSARARRVHHTMRSRFFSSSLIRSNLQPGKRQQLTRQRRGGGAGRGARHSAENVTAAAAAAAAARLPAGRHALYCCLPATPRLPLPGCPPATAAAHLSKSSNTTSRFSTSRASASCSRTWEQQQWRGQHPGQQRCRQPHRPTVCPFRVLSTSSNCFSRPAALSSSQAINPGPLCPCPPPTCSAA